MQCLQFIINLYMIFMMNEWMCERQHQDKFLLVQNSRMAIKYLYLYLYPSDWNRDQAVQKMKDTKENLSRKIKNIEVSAKLF